MDNLKERTAKGLLWGGIGNGGMQLLNLAFGIILARLLDSTDYGMVAVLIIFSGIASQLCESGFIYAIANRREVGHDVYNSVFWFNIIAGIVLYAILFFCAPLIARFYNTPELTALARFQFIGFVFSALGVAPSAYLFRNLMVKQRSLINLAAMVVSGVIGVACAMNGWRYWGIATQSVCYIFCVTLFLWIACPWHPGFRINLRPLIELLPFSSKVLLTNVFTTINSNVFAALLGRFYTVREAGFYSQGNKWVNMGYATINGMLNGVGQPVFREAAEDIARLRNVFRKMLRFTAFVCFPAMLGLAIVSRELIVITITDKWLPCVPIMQILCVWAAFQPIQTLYANLANSLGRPNVFMWNTIALGCVQLAILCLIYPLGLTAMLVSYTALNIGWLLIWHVFAHRAIGITLLDTLKDICPYLIISAAVMALTAWATSSITNLYISLAAKILMAAGLYCLLMWRLKSTVFTDSIQYLLKKKKL